MGRTVNYSFFVMIGLVFWTLFGGLVVRGRGLLLAGIFYLLLGIFLSGSRASLFTALFCLFLAVYFVNGIKKAALLSGLTAIVASPYLAFLASYAGFGSSNKSFLYFLSPDYLHNLQHQRLGVIEYFVVPYLRDSHLLFGLGPDRDYVVSYLIQKFNIPTFMNAIGQGILEDVYWAALVLYYGILGLLILALFIVFVYRKIGSYEPEFRGDLFRSRLIVACKILLITLLPLNLTNQAFEVRQFSFYLWVLIGFALSIFTFPAVRREDIVSPEEGKA